MQIDYQSLINEAMLDIVKKILTEISKNHINNEQSFYISFYTDFPGVKLSADLKKKYPEEITVVLQHQFKNLTVFDDKFSVTIFFGGVPQVVQVPFGAMTNFMDPLANFSLQFKQNIKFSEEEYEINDNYLREEEADYLIDDLSEDNKVKKVKFNKNSGNGKKIPNKKDRKEGKVIEIDKFRKKK